MFVPSTRGRASRMLAIPLMIFSSLGVTGSLAGCSGGPATSGGASQVSPAQDAAITALLAKAKTTMDATTSVRFRLTSKDVASTGTALIGGTGKMARPTPSTNAFSGDVSVLIQGSKVNLGLISVGNKVYARLPFAAGYQVTDPAAFGLTDPARLMDVNSGISRLFGSITDVTDKGERRVGPDVVRQLRGTVSGFVVADLLTSADPNKPVPVTLSIEPKTGQLRQATMTGPFFDPATDSTFTLTLDQYDMKVTITAPAVP